MRKGAIWLLAAAVLSAAMPALADPPHGRGKYGHHDRNWRDDDRHDRHDRRDRYDDDWDGWDDRRDEWRAYERGYREGYRDDWRYQRHSDWRYDRDWREGRGWDKDWRGYDRGYTTYRWKPGYYVPNYSRYPVIHDYRYYRLPPPGRGQYYVDIDGEIILIAAATGLILWALNQ